MKYGGCYKIEDEKVQQLNYKYERELGEYKLYWKIRV